MGFSVVSQKVGPPNGTWAPSQRIRRDRKVAASSARSSVSVSRAQRWQILWTIWAGLLAGTLAQGEGSSVVPLPTARAFFDFQNSTEVEQDLQSHSSESPLGFHAAGSNPFTKTSVTGLEGTAPRFDDASTSWDPSKASGPLSSGSSDVQVDTKKSEVLDFTSPSLGGGLAKTETPPAPPSEGLKDPADVIPVSQPVEKEKPGLPSHTRSVFPTFSPTLPHLPDARSSSHSDLDAALQMAASHSSRGTTLNTTSGAAQQTAATLLSSAEAPAPEGSQGGLELPRTSQSVTSTGPWTLLDQKSPSYSSDSLPSAEVGFLSYQAVKGEPVDPQMLEMSPSHSTLPMQTVPSEAMRVPVDVFYPSSGVTAHSFGEFMRHVSTGMQSDSPPTDTSGASSKSPSLLQEAVLDGQGSGGAELVPRDSFLGTGGPTMLSRSSYRPSPSHSHEVAHATLPDFVSPMASSVTKELGTHGRSQPVLFPTNTGSPKLDAAPALSAAPGAAQAITESDAESPLGITSVMEKMGTHTGVSEGVVHDWAVVSAPTGSQTLSGLSTQQDSLWSEAPSGFPLRNASLLVSLITGRNLTSSPHVAASTVNPEGIGTTTPSPYPPPAGMPHLHLSLSTTSLELDVIAPDSPTEAVPPMPGSTALGEEDASSGSTPWLNLAGSLAATEEQEGSAATEIIPSASPREETGPELKEMVSPTSGPSADAPRLDTSSTFLPTDVSNLPTFSTPHSRHTETRYRFPFPHSWASLSTSEAIPPTDVTDFGSYSERRQPEVHDGTGQIPVTVAVTISASTSELPLAASGAATPTDASSVLTSAVLGLQPAWMPFTVLSTKTKSLPSSPSSTFPVTSRMTDSKELSQPKTLTMSLAPEGTSAPSSTARSNATVSSQSMDLTGVVQPSWTSGAGKQPVGMLTGSPAASTTRELYSRNLSEWRHTLSTISQAVANKTNVMDTSRAVDTSMIFFAPSAGDRGSSKVSANLSLVESKLTAMTHPVLTLLSSNATTLLASSRILPTASVLPTTAACNDIPCLNSTLPASFTPLQTTSTQLPMTSPTFPQKILVTTWRSTVGKKGTMAGLSTKPSTQKMSHIAALTSVGPGTVTRAGPTSKWLWSTLRVTVAGQSAPELVSLDKEILGVHILSLQFQLARIEYSEYLENKSSTRYKKLEGEVVLTLSKMLSSYESFLQAKVLHFLHGSVVAQSEATFRGGGVIPTPSDLIRTIVTAVEQKEMDAFFDWRVDLKSIRCNEFTWKNLEPEVLALSFTVLGWRSIAVFDGLTDWGPLERLRNEVVMSLESRYRVQNVSPVQVRNMQGDLDVSGYLYVNTKTHVDIGWTLEALKGLVNYSVDLGSICINDSRLSLQIFPVSFLVTNRIFSEKLLDRSSAAHQSLSWDLSRALTHSLGQYRNLLQVNIRDIRGGSLICHGDMIFAPPAPTSKDVVHALALSVNPKNYLGASNIQVDPFSFTVAGDKLEPPFTERNIPDYGIALIVLSCLAVVMIPIVVLLYNMLGWKKSIDLRTLRDPEVTVDAFKLDILAFRSLTEDNNGPPCPPTETLGIYPPEEPQCSEL